MTSRSAVLAMREACARAAEGTRATHEDPTHWTTRFNHDPGLLMMGVWPAAPDQCPSHTYGAGRHDAAARIRALPDEPAAGTDDAEAANERDRSAVALALAAAKQALGSYQWLIEGRGPYAWDDDRWHKEFADACAAIRVALEPLEKIAHDLTNCPATQAEAIAARSAPPPAAVDVMFLMDVFEGAAKNDGWAADMGSEAHASETREALNKARIDLRAAIAALQRGAM